MHPVIQCTVVWGTCMYTVYAWVPGIFAKAHCAVSINHSGLLQKNPGTHVFAPFQTDKITKLTDTGDIPFVSHTKSKERNWVGITDGADW